MNSIILRSSPPFPAPQSPRSSLTQPPVPPRTSSVGRISSDIGPHDSKPVRRKRSEPRQFEHRLNVKSQVPHAKSAEPLRAVQRPFEAIPLLTYATAVAQGKGKLGANPIVLRFIRALFMKQRTMPLRYCTLQYDAGQGYRISSPCDGDVKPAHGKFYFLRMLNGELRLGSSETGTATSHVNLSSHSYHVAYAGEVEFANGELEWFSNQSGHYAPPQKLKHQSGFNDRDMPRFRAVEERQKTT